MNPKSVKPESVNSRGMIRPMRSAHGYTLVEMIVMLAMLIALLGGTVLVMSMVRTSDQSSSQNLAVRQEIRRFADDLRRDLRSASRFQIDKTKLDLTHAISGSEITYRVDQMLHQINRVEELPGSTNSASDRYAFGQNATIKIETVESLNAVRLTVTDVRRPDDPIRILAIAGETQP